MKLKILILTMILIFILFSGIADAKSPYGNMDVYYNGKLLPGTEVAKPNLKIGETFSVRVDVTLYQYSKLYIELCLLDKNHFDFIDGPAEFNRHTSMIFEENETHTFEWTLKPTDEWAGGTIPVDVYYSILLPDDNEAIVTSGFTIAYPYMSTEHYEGDSTPPTTTTPDSPSSTESPNSTPAFTLLTTALAIALAT
ncbi:MAG TPA: sarcinarray family MAST domain-containing protein, partial [Methanosarcinaceae archaeon]|nr:sarcinarray family MAST domain-containing protein [Methanosarcinaceae archaeon]